LVCLSSSAVEPDPALGVFFGKIMRPLLFKEMYKDMSRMECEVRHSDFDFRTAPSATPPRIASPRSASPPRR
jgi:hypothetical protein